MFQNCSEGFKYGYAVDGTSNSSTNPNPLPLPTPGPVVIPDPGTSMANFKTCYATSAVPATLAACLNNQLDRNGAMYSAAQITTCQTAGATSDILLATCMSKNNEVVQNHREAKQFD